MRSKTPSSTTWTSIPYPGASTHVARSQERMAVGPNSGLYPFGCVGAASVTFSTGVSTSLQLFCTVPDAFTIAIVLPSPSAR
jgi:hypothetical protein